MPAWSFHIKLASEISAVLNLNKQEQISKIVNTWNKQKKLYKKMLEQKERYYDSVINKLINGGNK